MLDNPLQASKFRKELESAIAEYEKNGGAKVDGATLYKRRQFLLWSMKMMKLDKAIEATRIFEKEKALFLSNPGLSDLRIRVQAATSESIKTLNIDLAFHHIQPTGWLASFKEYIPQIAGSNTLTKMREALYIQSIVLARQEISLLRKAVRNGNKTFANWYDQGKHTSPEQFLNAEEV